MSRALVGPRSAASGDSSSPLAAGASAAILMAPPVHEPAHFVDDSVLHHTVRQTDGAAKLQRVGVILTQVSLRQVDGRVAGSEDMRWLGMVTKRLDGRDPIVAVAQLLVSVHHKVMRLAPAAHDEAVQRASPSRSFPK